MDATGGSYGFLGLRLNPFNLGLNPACLVTNRMRRVFDDLAGGVESRRGLLLLTGEPGTGKTTLVNQLRAWFYQKSFPTAFIFNPLLETADFLKLVLTEFRIRADASSSSSAMNTLSSWLLARHRDGEKPVLIVDEAQLLSLPLLQALGLLVNLEAGQEKLLQIVLVGQPELNDTIKRPELRKIHQRVVLRCATAPLTNEELRSYLELRLSLGGSDGEPVFSEQAVDALQLYSRGFLRVINLLCEHALIASSGERVRPVPARIVEDVARRFQYDDFRPLAPSAGPKESSHVSLPPTAGLNTPAPERDAATEATVLVEPLRIANHFAGAPNPESLLTLKVNTGNGSSESPQAAVLADGPSGRTASVQSATEAEVASPDSSQPNSSQPTLPDSFLRPEIIRPSASAPAAPLALRGATTLRRRSWLVAAIGAALATCHRFSASLHRWLKGPIASTNQRRTLGTRRA